MRKALIPVLFLSLVGTAVPVFADPVQIVLRGTVDAHEGDNTFLLLGNGFRLGGEIPFGGPRSQCVIFIPCAPGTEVNLGGSGEPSLFGDPAIFNGRTYEGFTEFGGVFFSGDFTFTAGSIVVPDIPAGGIDTRSAPFTFVGLLNAYDNFGLTGTPLFTANLVGHGTATLQLSNQPEFGGINASRITYNFEDTAPVPEPASMLLLGSGLTGLALRKVRRRD